MLAGSGPLLYLVASHLIRKGHPLAAVLDQTPPSNMLKAAPYLPAGLLGLPLLLRGLSMLNDVRKSGTPVYRDVSGIEAQGADRLERVSFFSKGAAHTLEAAALLYHGGVIPRTHMANALDLPHHWDARQQCWTVGLRRLRQDGAGRRVRRRGLQPRTRCRRRWDSGRTGGSGRGGAAGRHRAGGIQAAQRTPAAFPWPCRRHPRLFWTHGSRRARICMPCRTM